MSPAPHLSHVQLPRPEAARPEPFAAEDPRVPRRHEEARWLATERPASVCSP